MATAETYPHVILNADGDASIEGTRYTVKHIAGEQYFYGWSAEEILRQHPDLRPAEVYTAIAYFHDHHDTIVAAIEAGKTLAERARSSEPFSRDELLRRRKRVKEGSPGQWHFRNGLPADGLSLSSEIGRVGRPVTVRQNAAHLPAVVFFLRRRRPRPSLPFPGLRRLAAGTAQGL